MDDAPDFAAARARMVAEQLEARGIVDRRVLEAMRAVPRHLFVPPEHAPAAYADRALPIAAQQTISQPFMVAVMTQALQIAPEGCVLEVGTGSGYQAAVLARLARQVISIERHASLAAVARERLEALGVDNVRIVVADGTLGFPPSAPYDGILVTAGAPRVPAALTAQLADGGRLVIPVGSEFHQELRIVQRRGAAFEERPGEGCVFVPLIGQGAWPER